MQMSILVIISYFRAKIIQKQRLLKLVTWPHTKPKFHEITVAYDKASIGISILEQISGMYKIESKIP